MTHHTQASEKKTATFNVTMVTAKRDFHCSTRSTRDVENDEIPQHSAVFFFCTNLSLSLFGSQPSSSFLLNATLVATYTSVHLPSLQALLEANTLLIAAEETYRTNARDH